MSVADRTHIYNIISFQVIVLFIRQLNIKNFRKFMDLTLTFEGPITIIQADNAKGKSSILESIYLLTTQSSPFTSDLTNLQNLENNDFFRIEALIENGSEDPEETKEYVLFQQGSTKQLIMDKKRTIRKKFAENIFSTIFSPEHIDLLMVSPQHRRDFLDNMITYLDPDHGDAITKMKKVLKQRNSYLKKMADVFYRTRNIPEDDRQFSYWTDLFCQTSSEVIKRRIDNIELMNCEDICLVYQPTISLGEFSDMMDINEIQRIHSQDLHDSKRKDVALGYTNVGAHRDDWSIDVGKDVRTHGSRGEKRMAIGRLIFKIQDMYNERYHYYPILLLDDISSELDRENTKTIINNALKDKQQTIITAIKLDDIPDEIRDIAQIITLE